MNKLRLIGRTPVARTVILTLVAGFIFTGTTVAATPKKVFTSKRYGYSLVLPRTWSMQQTPGKWPPGVQPLEGSPGIDAFSRQARALVGAARPVAEGTTLEAWTVEVASLTPQQCRTNASLPASLGGEPAHTWEIRCTDGANVIKIAALHAGQGYLFALVKDTQLNRADRTFFAKVVRTFKFTR